MTKKPRAKVVTDKNIDILLMEIAGLRESVLRIEKPAKVAADEWAKVATQFAAFNRRSGVAAIFETVNRSLTEALAISKAVGALRDAVFIEGGKTRQMSERLDELTGQVGELTAAFKKSSGRKSAKPSDSRVRRTNKAKKPARS